MRLLNSGLDLGLKSNYGMASKAEQIVAALLEDYGAEQPYNPRHNDINRRWRLSGDKPHIPGQERALGKMEFTGKRGTKPEDKPKAKKAPPKEEEEDDSGENDSEND